MCLFLQTQNFQQVTAALVTDMHASSAAANASLNHIRSDLQSQSQALLQSLTALSKLQAVQSQVEAAVQAGLVEVQAVGRASQGLQQSMDKSLNMTVRERREEVKERGSGIVRASALCVWREQVAAAGSTSCCICNTSWLLLQLQGALSKRHEQLMLGFNELESAHQQHAARAREAFDQLAQEAAALQQRQARYESLQVRRDGWSVYHSTGGLLWLSESM